jgi:hypothetical protein
VQSRQSRAADSVILRAKLEALKAQKVEGDIETSRRELQTQAVVRDLKGEKDELRHQF